MARRRSSGSSSKSGGRVRVRIDQKAVESIMQEPGGQRLMRQIGRDFASKMRAVAPKDTSAGANSIDARDIKDKKGNPAVDVGWDKAHFYMIFPEYGTIHQREQRTIRTLLESYTF